MRRHHPAIVAAIFAAAVVVGAAVGPSLSGAQQPPAMAPPPEPASSDPFDLFLVMEPVFKHPRCVNCHGAVDPFDVVTSMAQPPKVPHDGGYQATNTECTHACHDRLERWRLVAPAGLSFHNRSIKEICEMQADEARTNGAGTYLRHLSTDDLIGEAFIGLAAGARTVADPPPMSRDDFVQAAAEWLNVGGGCKSWTGEITQHETFASSYTYPFPAEGGPMTISVTEQAQRILTIDRADGEATFRINQGGQQTMVSVTRMDNCEFTLTSNSRWTGQNQAPARGKVIVRIRPDGSYTIRLIGPKEKTVTTDSGHASTDCPMQLPGPTADTTVLDWDPWKMNISCPGNFTQDPAGGNKIDCDLFDPERNRRLKGTMVRTIKDHTDAADPQTWMAVSPVSNSRGDDGSSIPITIVTTWDLTLPP